MATGPQHTIGGVPYAMRGPNRVLVGHYFDDQNSGRPGLSSQRVAIELADGRLYVFQGNGITMTVYGVRESQAAGIEIGFSRKVVPGQNAFPSQGQMFRGSPIVTMVSVEGSVVDEQMAKRWGARGLIKESPFSRAETAMDHLRKVNEGVAMSPTAAGFVSSTAELVNRLGLGGVRTNDPRLVEAAANWLVTNLRSVNWPAEGTATSRLKRHLRNPVAQDFVRDAVLELFADLRLNEDGGMSFQWGRAAVETLRQNPASPLEAIGALSGLRIDTPLRLLPAAV